MKNGVGKKELVESLEATLKLTRAEVESLELATRYEYGDTVIVRFDNGGRINVNISLDSGIAIIRDVCRAID